MGIPSFGLTMEEIKDLETYPTAAAYLVSWFLCWSDMHASDRFDDLLDLDWGYFEFHIEPRISLRRRLTHQLPEPYDQPLAQIFVLAVFRAGFIAEAMRCKAALEQLGHWHDE